MKYFSRLLANHGKFFGMRGRRATRRPTWGKQNDLSRCKLSADRRAMLLL